MELHETTLYFLVQEILPISALFDQHYLGNYISLGTKNYDQFVVKFLTIFCGPARLKESYVLLLICLILKITVKKTIKLGFGRGPKQNYNVFSQCFF